MARQRDRTATQLRAIIQRSNGTCLLVRRTAAATSAWEFPGVSLPPNSDPVEVLRRTCWRDLAVRLEGVIPQAAWTHGCGTCAVTYRCYLCPVSRDDALPLGYAELRWVRPAELAEYALDAPTRHMASWLLTRGGAPGDGGACAPF
jgi:hypothetical protein